MAKTKTVHVVGAGLSGMVAAINLAKAGYRVIVLEAMPAIGGDPIQHPSNHTTLFNPDLVKNYVGIDVLPYFHPSERNYFYLNNKKYLIASKVQSVERGPRASSLDTFLYGEAKKLGVEFIFSQEVLNPLDLPDPSIIATGLSRKMYEILHRPMMRLAGFSARRADAVPKEEEETACWFGRYTVSYAYKTVINKLGYYLLFSEQELSPLNLKAFEEHLEATEGTKLDHWDYTESFIPLSTVDAPRLFVGSKILAGTISGLMDPNFKFGIQGALLSGKIAALAVSNPEQAAKDFAYYSRNYALVWRLSHRQRNPQRLYVMKFLFNFPPAFRSLYRVIASAVPGIERDMLVTDVKCVNKK